MQRSVTSRLLLTAALTIVVALVGFACSGGDPTPTPTSTGFNIPLPNDTSGLGSSPTVTPSPTPQTLNADNQTNPPQLIDPPSVVGTPPVVDVSPLKDSGDSQPNPTSTAVEGREVSISCPRGQFMTGIFTNGDPICASVEELVPIDALARRLHGNDAAVIQINASGPNGGDLFGSPSTTRRPFVRFCREQGVDCIEVAGPGFRLSSLPREGSAFPLVGSAEDLSRIKELVTNGDDNYVQVIMSPDETPDPSSDWSKSGPESLFFRDPSVVSGGEDYVDLSGFELGDIVIRYDRIGNEVVPTNSTVEQTKWVFDFRIIFELAD